MTTEEKLILFERAVKFRFKGSREDPIYIESRGSTGWAVTSDGSSVYSTNGEWEYEPMPSNRDEDFIARTRFSLEEAVMIAERIVQ